MDALRKQANVLRQSLVEFTKTLDENPLSAIRCAQLIPSLVDVLADDFSLDFVSAAGRPADTGASSSEKLKCFLKRENEKKG